MVSNSEYTRRRRMLKKRGQAKARKRKVRQQGSTPSFPLDPPG